MFFALSPSRATLTDITPDLIDTYTAVRDDVESVIARLRPLRHDETEYYRVRASKPTSAASKAARFIYLNKTCFNGLYRVNLKGEFNVPFGRHGSNLLICDRDQLRAASVALATADLRVADFENVLATAKAGDLVYCDPPYTVAHTNNGFVEYNAHVFSWADQERLARVCSELAAAEVNVVISNADHESIRDLYVKSFGFKAIKIARHSTMAASAHSRFASSELLLVAKKRRTRGNA